MYTFWEIKVMSLSNFNSTKRWWRIRQGLKLSNWRPIEGVNIAHWSSSNFWQMRVFKLKEGRRRDRWQIPFRRDSIGHYCLAYDHNSFRADYHYQCGESWQITVVYRSTAHRLKPFNFNHLLIYSQQTSNLTCIHFNMIVWSLSVVWLTHTTNTENLRSDQWPKDIFL